MTLEPVLEAANLTALAAALAIFLLQILGGPRARSAGAVDFGAVFSVFLAGWIVTELLEAQAPAEWSGAVDVVHFAVLASFAVWMNARWRWSLHRARESP